LFTEKSVFLNDIHCNEPYMKFTFNLISADTPFGQVKLNEVGAWLARRNKNPRAVVGAISRGTVISVQP
jgi:hypothetical protein